MKKLLIQSFATAVLVIGLSPSLASASGDVGVLPPPPVVVPPPEVQPPPASGARPLPQTGAGLEQPLLVGVAALALGGGLVIVGRQRRRAESA